MFQNEIKHCLVSDMAFIKYLLVSHSKNSACVLKLDIPFLLGHDVYLPTCQTSNALNVLDTEASLE